MTYASSALDIHHRGGDAPNKPLLDRLSFYILSLGWLFYIVFAPLYIFKSGLPQPADFIIFITSGLAITFFLLKRRIIFNRVFAILLIMVGLIVSINLLYSAFLSDVVFYYSTLYYIFNVMVFGATIILFKTDPEKMVTYARYGVIASVGWELVWTFLFDSNSMFRQTGSFNNPNQLGYWALLSSSYLIILNYGRRMPIFDMIAFLICAYLISEALSRAALLAYLLILCAFFIGPYVSHVKKIGIFAAFFIYLLFQISTHEAQFDFIRNISSVDAVVERIESLETDQEAISERGYSRLVNFPEYLIYGAGEGAYWRFQDVVYTHKSGLELHSGIGTFLFSYGIFGFLLFVMLIVFLFKPAPRLFLIPLAAIMAYGLTHQHIRFSGFWIFIALVYAMTHYYLPRMRQRAQESLPA